MDIEEYANRSQHLHSGILDNPEIRDLFEQNSFGNIIDVGCGDGTLLYALHKNGYLGQVEETWAVDLSETRLQSIANISSDIKTTQTDAQTLEKIPDEYFDLVITTQVIEHVPDDAKMLESLARIAKVGSKVYLDTVFKKSYAWYFYKSPHGDWAIDPTHLREYSKDSELLDKVTEAGFEIVYSKKDLLYFPLLDFFVKRLSVRNKDVYDSGFVKFIRAFKLPIFGYYCWKMLLIKKAPNA